MSTAHAVMAASPGLVEGADRHLIDGRLVDGVGTFEVVDPATGEAFAACPDASRELLDQAVAGARRAFPAWAALGFEGRRERLHAFAAKLREIAPAVGPLLSREQGKPIAQAVMEVSISGLHVEHLSDLDMSDELLRDDARGRVEIRWKPLGVVGGIAPWNFPIALAMHKVAQALYTGNTLILKPSPYTPLSSLAVAAAARDIFPAGVLNIIAGGNDLGAWMTAHEGIDKISFTGSTATGKKVLASAAETLKRVTLELGGNDPAIVLEDADLDVAAAGIARSSFYNAGQICMAIKRVYAAAPIHDALVAKIKEKVEALKVGPGDAPGMDMGPIQNRMQYDKVVGLLNEALATPEAKLATGGTTRDGGGYFVEPTVISGLADDHALVHQEQFGPVLPVMTFDSVEDAVARANATRFGLGASVWSRDTDRAIEVGAQLEAGTVWINRHGVNESDVPFGGFKESGYGREHGVYGLRSYMEMQVISNLRG
jgi:acyl-CoA reductase-like NAD-dependent aldehyde dehydrogenase